MPASAFFVYWIRAAPNRHYIGATVDVSHRLRQHNGQIAGGARRTAGRGPWSVECVVSGFRTWREALQFEWAFKFRTRRQRHVGPRYEALRELMCSERWTSNAPLARDVPLQVTQSYHTVAPSTATATRAHSETTKTASEATSSPSEPDRASLSASVEPPP